MEFDLTELRKEIDTIDADMVRLFEQRMKVCENVARYKIENGKQVLDSSREAVKIAKVRELASNDFNRKGVEELFTQLMAMSRKKQYQMLSEHDQNGKLPFIAVEDLDRKHARVVYQGEEGAYTEAAMKAFFGEKISSFHVATWRDAMRAIEEGSADYAVLPIENSSAGIVSENYDLLVEFESYIVGEQVISIDHCLLGVPGSKASDIHKVYSHPQALSQCSKYLDEHREMSAIPLLNTATAARKVKEDGDITCAAIAGRHAASTYGLEILEEHINKSSGNSTRFIIVSNQKIFCRRADKISICFEIPHQSGSLYHMLSHFIYNDLNMNRIESRPIEDRPWEYRFFVDFEGNLAESSVKNALRGLREEARNMKILGNY